MATGKNTVSEWSGFIMIICIAGFGALSLIGCKTPGIGESADEGFNLDGDEEIFQVVDEFPRFPGCEEMDNSEDELHNCAKEKMLMFIYSNIEYPERARRNQIEGTVMVSFIVDRTGQIQNPKIIHDTGGPLGKEALRVVKLMAELEDKWAPGIIDGKAVNTQFNLPVRFIKKDGIRRVIQVLL